MASLHWLLPLRQCRLWRRLPLQRCRLWWLLLPLLLLQRQQCLLRLWRLLLLLDMRFS
jgi:hypothetical protein